MRLSVGGGGGGVVEGGGGGEHVEVEQAVAPPLPVNGLGSKNRQSC